MTGGRGLGMSLGCLGLGGLLGMGRLVLGLVRICGIVLRFGVCVWLFVCSCLCSGFCVGCVGVRVLFGIRGSRSRWWLVCGS